MKVLRTSKFTPIAGLIIGAVIGFLCFRLTYVDAGNLEPSSPPGSTMKTLDEVEARIPIPGSSTPLDPFTISTSGSYYLTGNRSCSGTGITVNADDVTIDLNGYSLTGPGTGTKYGIFMSGRKNVEIRNGTISSFGQHGIYENNSTGANHRIINVRAVINGQGGIFLFSKGNLVKDCLTSENVTYGIYVSDSSSVIGNISNDNGGDGITVSSGCTINNNTVNDNGGNGIYASSASTVIGNTCRSNNKRGILVNSGSTVISNTTIENEECGIDCAGESSAIIDNTVRSNNMSNNTAYSGIYAYGDCLIKGNTLGGNLQKNINTCLSDNVVEDNVVTDSTYGIYFDSAGCFYANNRASGNTTNYGGSVPGGSGDGGGNVSF